LLVGERFLCILPVVNVGEIRKKSLLTLPFGLYQTRVWENGYELLMGNSCVDLLATAMCRAVLILAGVGLFASAGKSSPGIELLAAAFSAAPSASDSASNMGDGGVGKPRSEEEVGGSFGGFAFRNSSMSSGGPRVSMPTMSKTKNHENHQGYAEPLLKNQEEDDKEEDCNRRGSIGGGGGGLVSVGIVGGALLGGAGGGREEMPSPTQVNAADDKKTLKEQEEAALAAGRAMAADLKDRVEGGVVLLVWAMAAAQVRGR
jgi:hypothetical protein